MNNVDYEKEYKRVFQFAQRCYGGNRNTDAALEYMFPQLKEEPEEKIRKRLINLTKCSARFIYELQREGLDPKEVREYLERQEEKPFESVTLDGKPLPTDNYQVNLAVTLDESDKKCVEWLIRIISTAGYRELDSDPMPCGRVEMINRLKRLL